MTIQLRSGWKEFTALKDNSGFGWLPDTFEVTAPDAVWDAYMAVRPGARIWRNTPCTLYLEFSEILENAIATGAHQLQNTGFDRVPSTTPFSEELLDPSILKRTHEDDESESESLCVSVQSSAESITPVNKKFAPAPRSTRRRRSGTADLAEALEGLGDKYIVANSMVQTAVEEAIDTLQRDEGCSVDFLVEAMDILEDEKMAMVFNKLPTEARRIWLERKLKK